MLEAILNKFKQFREGIFNCFSYRADATMELLDAISGNQHAKSIVELSLSPAFNRTYNSVQDAIAHFTQDPKQSNQIEEYLTSYCDQPSLEQPYRSLVLDCTAAPREHARTLEDKGIVHKSTAVPGNKPITVGHQYSIMGFLPEKNQGREEAPWILPLSVRRVPTSSKGVNIGLDQLNAIVPTFGKYLTVSVLDAGYGSAQFMIGALKHEHLVTVTRLRSNRIVYRPAAPKARKITGRRARGHELWYGAAFKLKEPETWGEPDKIDTFMLPRSGKIITAQIEVWCNLIMRQKNKEPLNEHPFTIARIVLLTEKNEMIHKRPMWLMVSGRRREELSPHHIWEAYKQRFDVEHFFKFGKTRLLFDKFQTPDTKHEESWWKISSLAYAQLYMARKLSDNLPNPWEKYLPEMQKNATVKSARQVQKSFEKLTWQIGTPASPPKPRGNPLGRTKGAKQTPRTRHPIVIKEKKTQNPQAA